MDHYYELLTPFKENKAYVTIVENNICIICYLLNYMELVPFASHDGC